jgi:hypothetical protein
MGIAWVEGVYLCCINTSEDETTIGTVITSRYPQEKIERCLEFITDMRSDGAFMQRQLVAVRG